MNKSAFGPPKGSSASAEVVRRPLVHAEALTVMNAVAQSAVITGYSYKEWTGQRDIFVLVDTRDGALMGALLVHHLPLGWSEIAVVLILEPYQGSGWGRRLMDYAIKTLSASPRQLVVYFCSSSMEAISRTLGFAIYGSQKEFNKTNFYRSCYMSLVYPPCWLKPTYRRREIRRKKILYGSSFDFRLAFMDQRNQPID